MSFKKILWALAIGLAFFAGTLVPIGSQRSSTVLAQAPQAKPPKYLEVDYMKVQPERTLTTFAWSSRYGNQCTRNESGKVRFDHGLSTMCDSPSAPRKNMTTSR